MLHIFPILVVSCQPHVSPWCTGLIVTRIPTALLVSRITTLLVSRVTTLVVSILLVIALIGLLLGIVLHLLPVVKVFAVSLDELVSFSASEARQDVFGQGMVLGDTWWRIVLGTYYNKRVSRQGCDWESRIATRKEK